MNIKAYLKLRYLPAMLAVLMAAPMAHAATSPDLAGASTYSVLAGTSITNTGDTTVGGDIGVSPGTSITGTSTITFLTGGPHLNDASAIAAQSSNTTVFGTLDQGCTQDYGGVTTELAGKSLVPGVYCSTSFHLSGTLTLQGTGNTATDVWIFKSASDLIVAGAAANVVFVGGGLPCNVWWRVVSTASLGAGSHFVGNILADTSVTLATGAILDGRALARTAEVTMQGNTITGPTCIAEISATSSIPPLINVRKVPSPLALPAGPGPVTYNYTVTNPGTVTLTSITLVDDKCSGVTYVSGDTNVNTQMETNETWRYTCSTTLANTTINYATARGLGNGMAAVDTAIAEVVVGIPVIPPLIHILKTPAPLSLGSGGGSVTYSYTVTNPGTVALSNVTVIDDKCSSVTRVSGDVNADNRLQSSETWMYTCAMNLTQSTVNTVIATGQANGLTAIDTALATVTVAGLPIPPLIHIIKKPEPAILPAGGGTVTYTYTVTNPGTVRLNNVSVTDDKCGPVVLVSGDINGNGMMGPTETWTYTCTQNLTTATTNTATATGSANGFTVTSQAIANVTLLSAIIAPAPLLPVTGFDPNGTAPLITSFIGILVAAALVFVLTQWERLF